LHRCLENSITQGARGATRNCTQPQNCTAAEQQLQMLWEQRVEWRARGHWLALGTTKKKRSSHSSGRHVVLRLCSSAAVLFCVLLFPLFPLFPLLTDTTASADDAANAADQRVVKTMLPHPLNSENPAGAPTPL
jgi:hypothetical protein